MCNYLNYSEHNCEFLACSEIRAANLSGQCNAFRRWEELGWVDQRECVEMRAKKSMEVFPACNPNVVKNVWKYCYVDHVPFKPEKYSLLSDLWNTISG